MTDFTLSFEKIRSASLRVDYCLVPWDTEIFGFPVAEIKSICVTDAGKAEVPYEQFKEWCHINEIGLCNCRVQHDQLNESLFLQNHGFRFIELNYQPFLDDLQSRQYAQEALTVVRADFGDKNKLVEMAGQVFESGRIHQDLRLGAAMGNKRYGIWMANSFSHPEQVVYKCVDGTDIIAFFVVVYPEKNHCHWSLIGLAPGFSGKGFGTRVWQRMLQFHQLEGMNKITTSISSHNTAVFNLYVKLGFRFPSPKVTFHWSR